MKRFARLVLAFAAAAAVLPPAGARAATVGVSIRSGGGNEFHPATILVHVGDYVSWTNDDRTLFQTDHNVMADDGSFSSKQRMKQGTSFEFKFNTTGSFPYHCTIHGWGGTVVVVAARPTATARATPTPTVSRTTKPKPSKSASPSATPDTSSSPGSTPSIDGSGIGSNTSSSAGTIVSIAIASITALILLGYFVYARFLRQD